MKATFFLILITLSTQLTANCFTKDYFMDRSYIDQINGINDLFGNLTDSRRGIETDGEFIVTPTMDNTSEQKEYSYVFIFSPMERQTQKLFTSALALNLIRGNIKSYASDLSQLRQCVQFHSNEQTEIVQKFMDLFSHVTSEEVVIKKIEGACR